MLNFLIRRLTFFVPMMFLMSVVAFTLIQLPPGDAIGDYIARIEASGEFTVDAAQVDLLKQRYGLDQPLYVQYGKWIWGVLHWDFGRSIENNIEIAQLINDRLLLTIALGASTILFTWALSIPIGILSAVRQYSVLDYVATVFSYIGIGTPNFLFALVLMWFLLSTFDVSVTGLFSREYRNADWSFGRVIDLLQHLIVPVIVLGTDGTARFTRIIRANMLDELSKPYVQTARSKGLPVWRLVLKYPTRLALSPLMSTAGWELPRLFSASLIVATVMGLPTMGPLLLSALLQQDMFLAGGIVMILTALTLIGTLLSDIGLAWIDPRVRISA